MATSGGGSENRATRCAGVDGPPGARRRRVDPQDVLRWFGLEGAPPAVQCSIAGHPWPELGGWEYVPPGASGEAGFYRRSCPRCGHVEVRVEWAWFG